MTPIRNRPCLRTIGLGLLALLISNCTEPAPTLRSDAPRPNIILVMTDDLGYGDISPYGQSRIPTPALDAMAEQGVLFTDFYASAPICAPSREALMRGRHTGRTVRQSNSQTPLKRSHVTIAERLALAGYTSAMIGKWALGPASSTGAPDRQGFDYWFGVLAQNKAHRHFPKQMLENGTVVSYPENEGYTGQNYSNDLFTQKALDFIDAHADRPFFLYLPLTLPHADITAPAEKVAQHTDAYPETPYDGGLYAPQPTPNAAFAAMIQEIDQTMAALVAKVEKLGLADNTLIIFTSDNGPVAVGGRDPEFFNSAGGFRGAKRDLYEGGIRVPFIAQWAGTIPPGTRTDHPASFEDLFPTFADIAGVPPGDTTTGRSILTVLETPQKPLPDRRLYWAYKGRALNGDPGIPDSWGKEQLVEAVRLGDWKAVRFGKSRQIELYNLATDPGETENVAKDHPDIAKQMRKIMRAEYKPG